MLQIYSQLLLKQRNKLLLLNESDLYYDLYTCTVYALLYKITLAGKIAARYQSALC